MACHSCGLMIEVYYQVHDDILSSLTNIDDDLAKALDDGNYVNFQA